MGLCKRARSTNFDWMPVLRTGHAVLYVAHMTPWTLLLVAAALALGVSVHFFGQGLWYMAVAEQRWDAHAGQLKPLQHYTWHRGLGRVVALLVAPAVTVSVLVGLWGYLP